MSAPYNFERPDWAPLIRAVLLAGLSQSVCGEFMWMCEEPKGLNQYKHRDTRRYANLTIGMTEELAMSLVRNARMMS